MVGGTVEQDDGNRYDVVFFFFQAEDGIRDVAVTGVQTCALPIYERQRSRSGGAVECPRDHSVAWPAEHIWQREKLASPSNPSASTAWPGRSSGCSCGKRSKRRAVPERRRCRARKPRGAGSRETEPGLAWSTAGIGRRSA